MTTTPTTAEILAALDQAQDAAIESGAYESYSKVRAAFQRLRGMLATPAEIAQPATPEPPQASAPSVQVVEPKGHDPLADFQEGQWWIKELDAFARQDFATNDQKRAVAVVHNLLRAAQASALQATIPAQQPASPEDRAIYSAIAAGYFRDTAKPACEAAAPDLLHACEQAVEWLEGWASAEPYIGVLRAAIAKAKATPLYASPTAQPATPQPKVE